MIYIAAISGLHLLIHAITLHILSPLSSTTTGAGHHKSDEVDEAGDVCGGHEHRDLPPDCIEVTLEEAIAIQNGSLRLRR